jgi:uncharacterized protein
MRKLSLIIFLMCFSTIILKAQELINKIEVIGQTEIEVEPDYFEYTINLQEYYKTETDKISIEILEKALVKAVEDIGVKKENLTINSAQGGRRYSSDNKPTNFLENRNYILKISSINDINDLLPKLDNMGLVNTSMVKKTIKKRVEYEKELRKKAVNNAKEKATSIAESLGKKIGDVIVISENNFDALSIDIEESLDFSKVKGYKSSTFKTDIAVEKIKLSFRVKVTFQMK